MISIESLPTETKAIRVRFLTRPQAYPSGVSAGQTIPQCVLWSCLGFVNLPYLERGVVTRLIWDKEEAKVSLFRTYETPVF